MLDETALTGTPDPAPVPEEPAAAAPDAPRRRFGSAVERAAWAVMAVTTGVILYNSWLSRSYQFDDALIYDRYFRNFYDGYGLVYNKGVHFNGLTSPLYAYLMAALGWPFSSPIRAAWAASTLGMLACAWLMYFYGRRVGNPLGFALGLLIGFSLPYFYLTYGMETGLFLAMIALCLFLYERGNYGLLAVASALLVMTRIEGGLLPLYLIAEQLIRRRKFPSWRILIAPALILAGHYSFNRYYYGTWVPDTGSAKIWQGESGLWGSGHFLFFNVSYLQSWVFYGHKWLWVLLAAVAVVGLAMEFRRTRPLIAFAVLYTAFYGVLNIPNYHWYYAPIFLIWFVYAGLGAFHLVRLAALAVRGQRRPVVQIAATLVVVGALMAYVWPQTKAPVDVRFTAYRQAGLWINEHLPQNASVSAAEIGTIGYYADRPFIDILGLVNPYNARFIGERKFSAWLTVYHPDYFLVHTPYYPHEVSVKDLVQQGKLWVEPDFHVKGLALYCQPHEPGCVPMAPTG